MDYANLAIIDLAKASTPEGRAEQAALERDDLREVGFFYVVNHGLTQPEVSPRTINSYRYADLPH